MKSFLLFAICATLTSSLSAQSSAYTPFQQSYYYSPNHTSGESSELFNLMSDPYLAIQANPADARFFRTGKTIVNVSWQSEEKEDYGQLSGNRNVCGTCYGPHDALFIPSSRYRSLPAMRPRLGVGLIHHFADARMSPVLGIDIQHFKHETSFIEVPNLNSNRFAMDSGNMAPIVPQNSHQRDGIILNTFLALNLSENWDAGLRYQVGTFGSDGKRNQNPFSDYRFWSIDYWPSIQQRSMVVSDAGQHQLTAGLTHHSARSSTSLSYSFFTGNETIYRSGSTNLNRNWNEYETTSKRNRHTAFARYSTELSSTKTFSWLGRAAYDSGPTDGSIQAFDQYEDYSPQSNYRVYYRSARTNQQELQSDATQSAIETGVGFTDRHEKWTVNFGVFSGYVTQRDKRTIDFSNTNNIYRIDLDEDGNEVPFEYSDAYQYDQIDRYHNQISYFRVPFLAEIHARSSVRFMIGAEMGYQHTNNSDADVTTRLWIGTRVSPSDHWNLTLRTQNIQKNSFSRYALNDMKSIMLSLTYSR